VVLILFKLIKLVLIKFILILIND